MKKRIELKVFSEATGKVFKTITVNPVGPLAWDFDEEDFVKAIKNCLSFFIGKTIFFSDAKNADELYQTLVNVRNIPKLETVEKEYRFKSGDGGTFTLMCKNKNGDTDTVCLAIKYIEER